ncbi:glutaminase [Billgrantia diversa]
MVPGRMTVCAWSPALDGNGNWVAAQHALELFAEEFDSHQMAT